MNPKVEEYLKKAREQELINRDLYEVKYYEVNEVNKEMKKKLKFSDRMQKYYEIIPYEVTDEEYDAILKTSPITEYKDSAISTIFYGIGGLAVLIGIIVAFGNTQAAIIWVSSLISGMLFIGVGKIIELLNSIKYK